MKKILIAILVVIVLIFAYSEYKEYKRFNPPNSSYTISEAIDLNYFDQSVVYNYNDAIQNLNGYIATQWSANGIDVKNPESDDEETQFAVAEYNKKLAKIKFYEAKLEQSKGLKSKGLTNAEIKNLVTEGISLEDYNSRQKVNKYNKMMLSNFKENRLGLGAKNHFVFEIQKLLVKKGYDIPVDGVYKNVTSNAIKDFETKNNLFSDGKLDAMTLDLLLK